MQMQSARDRLKIYLREADQTQAPSIANSGVTGELSKVLAPQFSSICSDAHMLVVGK